MNNRRTTEILLAFCLIAVAATGYVLVTALDRLRFELESLHATVRTLNEKISSAPLRTAATAVPEKPKTEVPMANAQFFDPEAVSGDRFISSIAADTKNMNYLLNNDATLGNALMPRVMDSLGVRAYDDLNKFLPQMAESWNVSPDGLRIRVKLRDGILWHDFTDPVTKKEWKDVPVTSEDFKFYVDVVKNPKVDAAPLRTYLADLDSVRVINDREFEVIWKKRYFLSLDMTLSLSPLPRHLYHAYEGPFNPERFNGDNERNRILVGCGPYRFIKWDKGHRILMTRWEKYYGARYGTMPPVKELAFDVIQHPNTRLQALLSKDLDSPHEFARIRTGRFSAEVQNFAAGLQLSRIQSVQSAVPRCENAGRPESSRRPRPHCEGYLLRTCGSRIGAVLSGRSGVRQVDQAVFVFPGACEEASCRSRLAR